MPRSWRSSDYVCPQCKNWNLGGNMFCATCNHAKPTLKTMGERCREFYPLAGQKEEYKGQRNCFECHAVVCATHTECWACRDRNAAKAAQGQFGAAVSSVLTTATGTKDAQRSMMFHGNRAIVAPVGSASEPPREKTELDKLCDKYKGVDPQKVIEDLERQKSGLPPLEILVPKSDPVEDEAEQKRLAEEREREKKQREEKSKKELASAKIEADRVDAERQKKRQEATDRIQAMLDADESNVPEAAASSASDEASSKPPLTDAEEAERQRELKRAELRKKAEELRKLQEDKEKKKEADEEERRKRMRERRAAKRAAPAATDTTVVLDD